MTDQETDSDQGKPRVLLVEDDPDGRAAMAEWLEREGLEPIAVADGQKALERIHDDIQVIVTDLKMPRTDGLELLREARKVAPDTAVIVVSGHGTVDTAVQALKEGAFDFLSKPVNLKELSHRIKMALEKRALTARIAALNKQLREKQGVGDMIGNSPAMQTLFEKIRLVADTTSTVLIMGESGTGKELVARALHQFSRRAKQPFVPVNCAAIPETLVESELFGHEKGAFTGATDRRQGLFQAADNGTLFIDEIGELPLGLQGKLLRAIESKRVLPVGSTQEVAIDVRLVAATNRDLAERVKNREFREDLYYRLRVVVLELPPLRDRKEDIPLLVRAFVEEIAARHDRPVPGLTPQALTMLTDYHWPGNVRELRNTLEGIIVLLTNEKIDVGDLPEHVCLDRPTPELTPSSLNLQELERQAIRRALEHTDGNRTKAADELGISVRTLQRKLKDYELN